MNELDSNSGLADQVAALQRQVFLLLLALIVVTGTLVAYLCYESHHIGKDVNNIQAQIIQPFDKKLPAIKSFVSQLVAYGNDHPEFRPILVKYGIETNTAPAKH
ncbi:MAG TPA: hypothetical protein VGI03_00855 [Verrucomicrobiae bacterium]|jgi:hypothetical protein